MVPKSHIEEKDLWLMNQDEEESESQSESELEDETSLLDERPSKKSKTIHQKEQQSENGWFYL